MTELTIDNQSALKDAVTALRAAIEAADEGGAEALCTATGWTSDGDSAGRLFKQLSRRTILPLPLGELKEADARAAVFCQLPSESRPRPLGDIWLHYVKEGGAWKLEGSSENLQQTTLFIAGVLPAIFDRDQLPSSPEAESWGDRLMADFDAGGADGVANSWPELVAEGIRKASEGKDGSFGERGSVQVGAVGRHAVGWKFVPADGSFGGRLWFILDLSGGGEPVVLSHARGPSAEVLLQGI